MTRSTVALWRAVRALPPEELEVATNERLGGLAGISRPSVNRGLIDLRQRGWLTCRFVTPEPWCAGRTSRRLGLTIAGLAAPPLP